MTIAGKAEENHDANAAIIFGREPVGLVAAGILVLNDARGVIDDERFRQVADFLAIQRKEAQWWRDASIAYFQSISGPPPPEGAAAPPHDLDHYKLLSFPYAPGH